MTVSHVSDEGERSCVHTQRSQLQSFQYLGKAVIIWNTKRDCHGRSPNYLLRNYFYSPKPHLGALQPRLAKAILGASQGQQHIISSELHGSLTLAWGSTNHSAFPQGHRNCCTTGRTLTRTSPSLPTACPRALKGFSQPSMFAFNFSTFSLRIIANLTMAKPELKSC